MMDVKHCSREAAVIAAAQAGGWTESLREHVARCPVCAEVLLVETELRRESELSRAEVELPSADLIWMRSRLAAQNSVLAPLRLVERWSLRFALAGTAMVVVLLGAAIARA
jgi:hypothetical protein